MKPYPQATGQPAVRRKKAEPDTASVMGKKTLKLMTVQAIIPMNLRVARGLRKRSPKTAMRQRIRRKIQQMPQQMMQRKMSKRI